MEALPDMLTRCLSQHQERIDQRRNFLHPDTAAVTTATIPPTPTIPPPLIGSPLLIPHARYGFLFYFHRYFSLCRLFSVGWAPNSFSVQFLLQRKIIQKENLTKIH